MTRTLLPLLALLATAASAQVAVRVGAGVGASASNVAIALDGTLDATGDFESDGATITFSDPETGGIVLNAGLRVQLVAAAEFVGTAVTGSAQIAGPLEVSAVPGTAIEAGDTFEVLTCSGTCSGTFTGRISPFGIQVVYGPNAVTVEALEAYTAPSVTLALRIDGERGVRYLGPPAQGMTVDDLAAQNLVRGVPGYFPDYPEPTLWTTYDPIAGEWLPTGGAGDELPLGKAFRWYLLDRDGVGNPSVSVSRELPFTLTTALDPNTQFVRVTLDTEGNRFNHLANPFAVPLDVTGIRDWQGGHALTRNSRVWTYDPAAATWAEAATVESWQAFRFRARGPRRNGNPRVLTIPASAQAPDATRTAAPRAWPGAETRPSSRFNLAAATPDGRPLADRSLAVVFDDEAGDGFDIEEDVEKFQPPATAYALVGARVDGALAAVDARPWGPAEIPLAVGAHGAGAEMTLAWDAHGLPGGLPVTLVDLATGAEVDLRSASSYTFRHRTRPALADVPTHDLADAADAADRFVLRVGAALASGDAPDALALAPPAPNPSDGAARLPYALPEAGPVHLAVFDVRGRRVAVLAEGPRAAGWHEAALPRGLSAGVYVVRLEALGQVLTQRATVVR